ncbi:MAG: HK97 family phage prohead protease [Dehalococcoidia bacterium]
MDDLSFKTLATVEVKDVGDDAGTVVAHFAAFDEVDRDQEITAKGAFGNQDVLLGAYGHASTGRFGTPTMPVGIGKIHEEKGIAVFEGKFNLDMQAGREAFAAVKMAGPLQEWSYGFMTVAESVKIVNGQRIRQLDKLKVHEVSPVMLGAANASRTASIKSMDDMTLEDHADAALTTAADVVERIKWTADARAKSGRTLSAANVTRLQGVQAQAQALDAEITKLLEDADPKGSDDPDAEKALALQVFAEFQHSQSLRLGAA